MSEATTQGSESTARKCQTCHGSGETVSEMGPADCPDCGGSGILPSRATLTDWRARDIERHHGTREGQVAADVRWLLAELRRARGALTQIVALAMDGTEKDPVVSQIRGAAYDALGLYDTLEEDAKRSEPS